MKDIDCIMEIYYLQMRAVRTLIGSADTIVLGFDSMMNIARECGAEDLPEKLLHEACKEAHGMVVAMNASLAKFHDIHCRIDLIRELEEKKG